MVQTLKPASQLGLNVETGLDSCTTFNTGQVFTMVNSLCNSVAVFRTSLIVSELALSTAMSPFWQQNNSLTNYYKVSVHVFIRKHFCPKSTLRVAEIFGLSLTHRNFSKKSYICKQVNSILRHFRVDYHCCILRLLASILSYSVTEVSEYHTV